MNHTVSRQPEAALHNTVIEPLRMDGESLMGASYGSYVPASQSVADRSWHKKTWGVVCALVTLGSAQTVIDNIPSAERIQIVHPIAHRTKNLPQSEAVAVLDFYARNPGVADCVKRICEALKENGIEQFSLEHYEDAEEGWEKLFVILQTGLENDDEISALESKVFSLTFPVIPETELSKIIISVV